MTNKYLRTILGVDKAGNVVSVQVDIYSVLDAFQTKNPALDHLVKKALCPGQRGHKDLLTDLDDIIASAKRAKELVVNRMACTTEVVLEDTPENMQMLENAFMGERRTDTFVPVSITTEGPEIAVNKTGISPVAPIPRRTGFDRKTLCYYPDKLQAEGLLKTFQQLAQGAGIVTRAVQRCAEVDEGGILVDGPAPSETTVRRFLDLGISLYGVREANVILRGHLTVARDKAEGALLSRPTSFSQQHTIFAFPEALGNKNIDRLRDAAAGVCRFARINNVVEAPIGAVVVGSFKTEDKLIEGRHAFSIKEALEILAKDQQQQEGDLDA